MRHKTLVRARGALLLCAMAGKKRKTPQIAVKKPKTSANFQIPSANGTTIGSQRVQSDASKPR